MLPVRLILFNNKPKQILSAIVDLSIKKKQSGAIYESLDIYEFHPKNRHLGISIYIPLLADRCLCGFFKFDTR